MSPGDCLGCHTQSELLAGNTLTQRDQMLAAGAGIPMTGPSGVFGLSLGSPLKTFWVRRGSHSPDDLGRCSSCHPKHPSFSYPFKETGSAPAADCASSCHTWLGDVMGTGFVNSSGKTGSFSGSIRPADLLSRGKTGHSTVWKEGYGVSLPRNYLKVVNLKPGCTGCHNAFSQGHGTIPRCTECHNFSRGFHDIHIGTIQSQRGSGDPAHVTMRVCGYCHPAASSQVFANAACYACHLSGHDPSTPYWVP